MTISSNMKQRMKKEVLCSNNEQKKNAKSTMTTPRKPKETLTGN